ILLSCIPHNGSKPSYGAVVLNSTLLLRKSQLFPPRRILLQSRLGVMAKESVSAPTSSPAASPAAPNIFFRLRYSPFLTQMVVIRRCNLSCGYCSEYDKSSDPVPVQVLEDRLR